MNRKGYTEGLVNHPQLMRDCVAQSEIKPETKSQGPHLKSNLGYTTTGQLVKTFKSKLC